MRIILALLFMVLSSSQSWAVTQWAKGKPASGDNLTAYPTAAQANNSILDTLISNYRRGYNLSYSSGSTLTASAGEIVVSNSGGTVRIFLSNSVSSNITFSNIDTGAEASNTTYYVYCGTSTATDASCTFYISASSSSPTGVTYYARLGSFTNDGSSNISGIVNDNQASGYVGAPSSKSFTTIYQALTDGDVQGFTGLQQHNGSFSGYTDSSSSPTTVVQYGAATFFAGSPGNAFPIHFKVRKGDYYKVTESDGVGGTLYFVPSGS